MNVFVIGANGQIGQHLVRKLGASKEHNPIPMVRKEEQLAQFRDQGMEVKLVNLEGSINDLASAMQESKADAVVFTAGSGGHTGADKTMLIDLDGAIKSMKAAQQAKVNRFVIVSAIGAHRWHDFSETTDEIKPFSYYGAAKYYADSWLETSGLDYTIIRPGHLTNSSGTGKIGVGVTLKHKEIPREDVASTIIASLNNRETIGKAFDLISGKVDIEDELKKV